jgi:LacI family transcriptional regulator, galactose operon repressor
VKPPRLKDVAEAAGVHLATASRALDERRSVMVRPETVERVRKAAADLGYRVNRMARGLKMNRSFTIGMLVPDITNPFFPPIVRGAEDCLAEAGYTLVLANTDNDEGKERRHLSGMLERQVDGLLLAMARRRDALVEELQEDRTATVLINRTIDRGGVSAVIPDDQAGMTLAVEHLHALAHRRIAHVAGPQDTSTGARRAAGFRAAMQAHSLSSRRIVEAGSFGESAGREAARGLFDPRSRPSAVVAANDLIALGVVDAAADAGLRCPEDVSIVGFNDMPFAERFCPPLTTVRIPEYLMGRRAAQLLLLQIDDPERRPETILVTPELIVRGSTMPAAGEPGKATGSRRLDRLTSTEGRV